MKKIVLLSIVLAAGVANAATVKHTNRSRNQALQFSPHILNFYSPENLNVYANTLTIETGSTTEGVTDLDTVGAELNQNAEGTLIKTFDFGTLGFTLGHQEDMIISNRIASGAVGIDGQQNPIQIGYGMKISDLNVGAALVYSNYNDKAAAVDTKESTMGVKVGVLTSAFYANAMLMFADKYETATVDYKGDLGIQLNGGYFLTPDTGIHATVISTGFKEDNGGAEEKTMSAKVMVIDTLNSEAAQFFYGAGILWGKNEDKAPGGDTTDILALPVIFGLEVNASSWVTVRGSVTQNVLLSKVGDLDPSLNTTTFAGGLGLNFNKISVDGAVTTSDDEYIGGKASLTYMF